MSQVRDSMANKGAPGGDAIIQLGSQSQINGILHMACDGHWPRGHRNSYELDGAESCSTSSKGSRSRSRSARHG